MIILVRAIINVHTFCDCLLLKTPKKKNQRRNDMVESEDMQLFYRQSDA